MAEETEFGECCVCTDKAQLTRTYWHYDIDCDCHSPKHFEVRRHCRFCTPNEPLYTEVDYKGYKHVVPTAFIRKKFWIPITEKTPLCFITGDLDGKKSEPIFVRTKDGSTYVAECYQGKLDGYEFCDFYTRLDGHQIVNVTHYANIPID